MLLNERFDYSHLDTNANTGHASEGEAGIPVRFGRLHQYSRNVWEQNDHQRILSESGLNRGLSRRPSSPQQHNSNICFLQILNTKTETFMLK